MLGEIALYALPGGGIIFLRAFLDKIQSDVYKMGFDFHQRVNPGLHVISG